jgi:hypothetical protein
VTFMSSSLRKQQSIPPLTGAIGKTNSRVDAAGQLNFADSHNHRIRKIDLNGVIRDVHLRVVRLRNNNLHLTAD